MVLGVHSERVLVPGTDPYTGIEHHEMTFKFGSWNVNRRSTTAAHIQFLSEANCDLLAVQEATTKFHTKLSGENLFDWSQSSLKFRQPLENEGIARRLGCSIFGRARFRLESCDVLPDLHFPERALVACTVAEGKTLTVASFHVPPGASWGCDQTANAEGYRSLARGPR